MKKPDIRLILMASVPLAFALLFILFLLTIPPEVSPAPSIAFNLLFSPFVLMAALFIVVFSQAIAGILVFALLCVAVQYGYVKILLRGQGRELIAMVVATYLLTGLLVGMVLLFPTSGQAGTDIPQLSLSKVDKNETSEPLIHFTQQDLEESPALQSLIESGHTNMSWGEYDSFQRKYPPGYFVEYNGTYYKFIRRVPKGG